MAEPCKRKLSELKKLPNNPRTIKDESFKSLCKSIQDNPDYFEARPCILSDRTGELIIIAGNQRYDAAKHLKLKEIPTHLIPGLTEEREREIIIRDNVSNGEWFIEELQTWDKELLKEWGVDLLDSEDKEYTTKVTSPIYEKKGEKPNINKLFDLAKYNELVEEIENSDINIEDKEFLLNAAKRHIVFNYAEIAEYYAHSDKKVQELMENSALIIIDYNKAIEKGFVKIYDFVQELAEIDG